MKFLLDNQNVFDYLAERGLCDRGEANSSQIQYKNSRNFNLEIRFPNGRHFLIKQERQYRRGKRESELFKEEWQVNQLLQQFSELSSIHSLMSEATHFDVEHSILVLNYFSNYFDLENFYNEQQVYPSAIATSIGASLAKIHRTTIDREQYKNFLNSSQEGEPIDHMPHFLHGLERISPEIFGKFCLEGIEFFKIFQLYDSLKDAIALLNATYQPCCLIHNDLKLDNILVHNQWEQLESSHPPVINQQGGVSIVRIIDWEHSRWGEPGYDLGKILASYLQIWLNSLAIDTDIDMETSLRLAITPLERLQPSIAALTKGYFDYFPEILQRRPDFLTRVMQFTGFALIRRIRNRLDFHEPIDNTGICAMQVAKTLLCRPEQSIPVVFGDAAAELTNLSLIPT